MIDPNKKTLIFDFGNVLFNLDFGRSFDALENIIGLTWSFGNIPDKVINTIRSFERGQINDEEFIWVFQQYKQDLNPRDLISAWNSMLVDLPIERLNYLQSLREDYNLALLSNINSIHLRWIHKYFSEELDIINFEETYFDKVFYSHLVGMRKPDSEIYEFVTRSLGIEPNSILFIDDLESNIKAAKENGWHAIVHDPKDEIINKLIIYIEKTWTKN